MPERSTHPSREELSAYSLGQLPQERAVAIDSHISECEPCCETIVSLSSDDTFVGLLQEARQLPADQTIDQEGLPAKASSSLQDVPAPLAEHPRYEIVGLIGKGGMGDVYKARHRMMERTVALKIINRELVRKPEVVDRFHREVKTAAQLSHPNIVTAYDAEQAGDFHFLVMEYVDGVDLSQTVKDRGALPIADACDYIRQAAIGLQHAHQQGMVHRDIKPHNLMVTADGTVKILDFGLASLAPEALSVADTAEAHGDLTAVGAIMGTPDFISPEQANDARQADIRSDIYSLGTTLYFLLSGRPPFTDGSVMHKLKSHAQAEPEPLESLRDDIPAELAVVISRMIAKDPDERFQTPAEVAEALESFSRASQGAQQQSPPHQVQPGRQRSRILKLTAVATLFVAAIVAAVVYYIQTNNGTVRVEVTDPSMEVTISGQTIKMKEGNKEPLEIRAGECVLIVRQGDFEFETDNFQIRRNEDIAFKVERLDGEVVVSKDGEKFKSMSLPNVWSPPENPDPQAILQEAHADTRGKNYKIALAKHVWLHKHALSIDPAFYGVRLSFALSYWLELAKQYPPALEELKEIRDEAEKNVLAGKAVRESFQDLAMINKHLDEHLGTKRVFEVLDKKSPNTAKQVFYLAQPSLVRSEAYSLIGKYIAPKDDFAKMRQTYRRSKISAGDPRFGASLMDSANKKFANDSTTLVAILTVNDRKKEAEEIAASARKEWDDRSFHAALEKALKGVVPDPWPSHRRDGDGLRQRSQPKVNGNVEKTAGRSNDHKNIQGSWQVTYSEDSGRIAPQGMLKNLRFVFTKDTMTTEIAGRKSESTYKLDPSTNPKSVDFTENGRTKPGIYDLQGDTLRICIAEGRPERPTAFDSQPDSPNDLVIMLKRIRSGQETTSAATQIQDLEHALDLYKLDCGTYPLTEQGLKALIQKTADEKRAENWSGPYLKELPTDPWGNPFGYEFPGTRGGDETKPDIWSRGPDGKDNTDDDIRNWVEEADRADSPTGIILDQGYTILDNGKEIGSRRLVVTEEAQTLSIVEEYSLALKWEGAPLGIVQRDVTADYSLAGEEPLIMRGATSTKEQGSLVMHGTVEFKDGEVLTNWTSYTERGRKLETPRKQQNTVKPPSGPLVLGSTIQVVGPLLLPEDGERKVVCATFNNQIRAGKPLVEYEAGCKLRRTSRPESAGFTITLFKPDAKKPEMTWEYDGKGNCENVRMGSTNVMKPHGTPSRAEAAWRTDIVAFEKHLGKLSADARVPGRWRGPDADVVPITNGTHGYIDLNPAEDTVQFRVNEALKGRTVNWELELAQDGQKFGSTLHLRPVCEGDAKENEKATPFLNFLILQSPRVPLGTSGFKAGDRVKLEGTIGDFANNKRIDVTFSPAGPVAIYHSDASSHPVFWVGFTEVTITLVDVGDLAKEIDDLEGRLRADPQYLMQLLAEDRDKGETLLRAGQKQRPTARPWAMDVQMLFAVDRSTGKSLQGKEKVAHFKHALEYLQESYDIAVQTLDKSDDQLLQAWLPGLRLDLALAALEAGQIDLAKQHAAETLRNNTDRQNWNDGDIIHNANQILGRCALREEKLADAKTYLLKAGATPGSPGLNSYGPQMQLARELLEKGEKETVLEYLDLVARFWANPNERTEANSKSIAREHLNQLEAWKKQLRAGKIPDHKKWK